MSCRVLAQSTTLGSKRKLRGDLVNGLEFGNIVEETEEDLKEMFGTNAIEYSAPLLMG